MPKKLRVKDLKHDEVSEAVTGATTAAWGYASTHRRTLIAVVAGALALVLVVGLATWWHRSRNAAAETALGAALRKIDTIEENASRPPGSAEPVPADAPTWTSVAAELEAVSKDHDGTPAGELAAFHAGVAKLRAGDAAGAAASLDAFVEDHDEHWATPMALSALATAREATGDVAGAEQALVRVRDGEWRSFPRAAAIMQLGALMERQGRKDEARQAYELLTEGEEFASSAHANLARQRLQAMGIDDPSSPASG